MELKKIVRGVALAMGMAAFSYATVAQAEDQGSGSIVFKGKIIKAPCSIMGNPEQTVWLGQLSDATLAKGGTSPEVNFKVELEKCTFDTTKPTNEVTVTFTGPKGSRDGSLSLGGQMAGADIMLKDQNGEPIKLGTATPAQALNTGNNTLSFKAYVQGDDTGNVSLGDFTSTAGFTLAYQ